MSESIKPDWTKADKNGTINIPDELDGLFNKLGFQLRFHTFSGKNEIQTVVDMVYIAQKYFKEHPESLNA
jgi:hypothetical protein